jgi:membrane dipeptidase
MDDFVEHIDAAVERVGIDHVGLGIDYYAGQSGVASDEAALRSYNAKRSSGIWGTGYPPPPHHYPAGIEVPSSLPNLTRHLLERGYEESAVRKIMGENWVRVMRRVWGT